MYKQAFLQCVLMANSIKSKALFQSTIIFPTVRIVSNVCRTANFSAISRNFHEENKKKEELEKLLAKPVITQEDVDQLLTNPEYDTLYKLRQREVELSRHLEPTPEVIRPEDWVHLMSTNSKLRRRKYLRYRFLVECQKNIELQKKEMKVKLLDDISRKYEINFTKYNLHHNALFLRISMQFMNDFYNKRLMTFSQFAPKIVFDCGYERNMNSQETLNCGKQLLLSFSVNRSHKKPMDLYFCNLATNGLLRKTLSRYIPIIEQPGYPLNVNSECYMNLFDKDKLVYLSPHASLVLKEFDEDKVYIIGAYVDKSNPKALSLAKARKNGIPAMKFPLERYLPWGSGSTKNLTMNQSLAILLEVNDTNDWHKAFQHVPSRKLQPQRVRRLVNQIVQDSKFVKE